MLDEKVKQAQNKPHDERLINMFNRIITCTPVKKDSLTLHEEQILPFDQITEKILYNEALIHDLTDHHSQAKWVSHLNIPIEWQQVWQSVHNRLSCNKDKNTVWEQIHLNFYTQFSYNKWHNTLDPCPLCHQIPTSIFHIILNCNTVNNLWEEIEPTLKRLHDIPVTNEEKAFGITGLNSNTGVLLRNWLTYLMRQVISDVEKQAYYSSFMCLEAIKKKVLTKMITEISQNQRRYEKQNNLKFYDDMITHEAVLCRKMEDGGYNIFDPFLP